MLSLKKAQLNELFARFVAEVPITPADVDMFRRVRQAAARNFEQIPPTDSIQASYVDQILLLLLPHANTANNRNRGAWIHWSPVINGDIRHWYEASGWTEPSDWPQITRSITELVRRCITHRGEYAAACREFSYSSFSKGFQSGMISPILNALNPAEFLLINNRTRSVLNYFGDTKFSQSLADYGAANEALHTLLDQIEVPIMGPLMLSDHFDLFAEWLLVDQKFVLRSPQHWLLRIGNDEWTWQAWQEGNFVAIGWDELGDLSDVRRSEFELRRDSLIGQYRQGIESGGWSKSDANQAWTFATQLYEGDQLLICRGPDIVLGVATIVGPYYYVPETPQGHRLPVEWADRTARVVSPSSKGMKNLLFRLDASIFSAFLMGDPASAEQVQTSLTPEPTNGSGPSYLRFCVPLIEALREDDQAGAGRVQGQAGAGRAQGRISSKSASQLYDAAIQRADISEAEQDELTTSGSNRVRSQVERARYTLAQAGLIESPKRGIWQLTPAGLDVELSPAAVLDLYEEVEYQRRIVQTLALESPEIRRLAEAPTRYVAMTPPESDRPPTASLSPTNFAEVFAETYLDETKLATWMRNIERKKQAILYGPPGTGKTFVACALADHLADTGDGFAGLVQFHPAYAYEDFIQGIRPEISSTEKSDNTLIYRLMPGHFLNFCAQARQCSGPCVLIIDEINRANLANVFGELMYLLEYRDQAIMLAGGGEPFRVPDNVHIIGTMNSADRSIALVDHALRRRFAFIALDPDYDVLRRFHDRNESGFPIEQLIALLQRVNDRIADRQYVLGHSYFLRQNLADEIVDIWQMEIEPYLEEYFFDQPERVEEFRWTFVREELAG